MYGRKGTLWLAATIGVLALLVPASASALTGPTACNGATELCDKPFNEVVLPGTHNSMSSQEYNWVIPNQIHSIPTQLEMGVRAFLIDTHYGKPFNGGPKIENSSRAQATGMFLCHDVCLIGSSPLVPELAKVADFLAANPREVLMFVNEAGVTPDDFAQAVADSGLLPYVYPGSTSVYPTLFEMIESNQRVVMLSESGTGTVPWYHAAYSGPLQETPYDFRKDEMGTTLTTSQAMDQLTGEATLNSTCRANRGGETGPLFLMNHWVNGLMDASNPAAPDPAVSRELNQKAVLVNRARACETRRGLLPTIIAVDHFGEGDLLGAVDELNGVAPDPDPEPDPTGIRLRISAVKKVKVRAGKRATFRVTVRNVGDRMGTVRVCTGVPARLARKTGCLKRKLRPGAKAVLKVKVRTKPRARGKGRVKFTATAAGRKRTAGSNLIVKPLKKKRR